MAVSPRDPWVLAVIATRGCRGLAEGTVRGAWWGARRSAFRRARRASRSGDRRARGVAGGRAARTSVLPGDGDPWQRGSNENTNGLLRQYFPKGFDFSTVTEIELDAVADELNQRPRKRLAFATPTEQLSELLLQ
jgi:hypothetical protein